MMNEYFVNEDGFKIKLINDQLSRNIKKNSLLKLCRLKKK